MAGGFGVEPDEVRSHAKKVSEVGDRLGEAGSAAGEGGLNPEAFGIIGQFLVPHVMAVTQAAKEAISTAEEGTEELFNSVKKTAEDYERNDEHLSTLFTQGNMGA